MTAVYRVSLYMVGVNKERATDLRLALAEYLVGSGKLELKQLMRRAHEGERILVYQTNDDDDAKDVGRKLSNAGAEIDVVGLKPPEPEF